MNFWGTITTIVISVVLSGIVGFYLGKFKEFRESKQKIYSSIIPVIIKMYYNPQKNLEEEYNKSVILSWLYSNRSVARKLNKIASIIVDRSRSEHPTQDFQDLIIEMRKDIQPFNWQRLKADDVEHIYTIFKHKVSD